MFARVCACVCVCVCVCLRMWVCKYVLYECVGVYVCGCLSVGLVSSSPPCCCREIFEPLKPSPMPATLVSGRESKYCVRYYILFGYVRTYVCTTLSPGEGLRLACTYVHVNSVSQPYG